MIKVLNLLVGERRRFSCEEENVLWFQVTVDDATGNERRVLKLTGNGCREERR